METTTDAELAAAITTNMLIDRDMATPADDQRLAALRTEAARRGLTVGVNA